ncbi:hypothetical protein AXG93_1032s1000 [Marchantia polymorpha subsp. ruderalis]|uniref:Uncharacterized protein n=1 Tax=Marchantia polymorpha subsp. ruderalis TaxID=1480154 RepID=A0A176VTQ8_MARPO|nr:hypothetical protein AXG93_1032s1000 [Marchantia polymorpha subsp. ruderalis]
MHIKELAKVEARRAEEVRIAEELWGKIGEAKSNTFLEGLNEARPNVEVEIVNVLRRLGVDSSLVDVVTVTSDRTAPKTDLPQAVDIEVIKCATNDLSNTLEVSRVAFNEELRRIDELTADLEKKN